MSLTTLDPVAEFSTTLERREAALLGWGLVDGSFSGDELEDLAERFLTDRGLWGEISSADELVARAEDRGLLFPLPAGDGYRYRSRTAESVRLFLRLRQLFPKHLADGRWLAAPTLVADARFLLRPRSYPRRHLPAAAVASRLDAAAPLSDLQRDAAAALTDGRDLADFQVRAGESILRGLRSETTAGTIVCAGTGSGKTLAFYLPAFVHLCGDAAGGHARCLALYPRNELLKDQFSEAYALARRLDGLLAAAGRRKVRIGALFGATPRTAGDFDTRWRPEGWKRVAAGYVCPLLRCPREGCRGRLVWRDEDRKGRAERLVCSVCGYRAEPNEIVLTRERLLADPPDVLFTTTEMLNQRMGDSRFGRLFGVGTAAGRKPDLVLLDEAHTYGGLPGAQAALLIRRWLHASRATPHFVGLSATLRDARRFFATLAGLPIGAVFEETPTARELELTGTEYLLALRGDPGSGASLLSTTLQATMLLRRVLDPARGGASDGLFGSKLFLFTDALDVTNRLYFDLRDAEGQDSWGNPDRTKAHGSLANLRASAGPEAAARLVHGQSWDLCEAIGHPLRPDDLVRVGRTTSQDAGVDADADAIVATAALEVGFNDPAVGAVLQHKAPKDPAAFLQRKGRAGRHPRMRPWTVVVLSDYGRDRLAYQSYDLLFDPDLPARDLPVENRHVIRMQAVYATMDWLATQLEGLAHGGVWQDLAQPWDRRAGDQAAVRERQDRIATITEEVITRPERQEDLARYLRAALRVSDAEIDAVFWDPPRPLLTVVLPAAARRLRRQWRAATATGARDEWEFFEPNAPLPEFVPRALFQDLNLPEVMVVTEPQQTGDAQRRDALPVVRALAEFAPGRVSRRYGIMNRYARHWISPPALTGEAEQALPVTRFFTVLEEAGTFEHEDATGVHAVRCMRPWVLEPAEPPRDVLDSSNAYPEWRTQILPEGTGVWAAVPARAAWGAVVAGLRFFSHRHRCPVELRRFALGSRATITFEDGTQLETRIRYLARQLATTPPDRRLEHATR
jgi:superfamily II DNA or RNA helicase